MAVDFPSSPTPGQVYTQAGATWTWDGVKWVAQGTGTGVYLPLAGGVMTGDITLKGDPSAPLHPVTKQMLDAGFNARALAMNDNRIINGDMRIDQRNAGASGTAGGYTIDRWQCGLAQTDKGTWRQYGGAMGSSGFQYSLGFVSSSAYTPVAADYFGFNQAIEADMMSDFQWGTPQAQPVTLSFWAYSSLAGLFSGSILNYAATRGYPFTFSLPAATWTKCVVTIPGDTGGTWVLSGNAGGAYVVFDLGSGSTRRGPAGAWANGGFYGANGAVSVVGTNAATFYVTGVKLEIGSVATPYNRQSLAKSMADCQRYYQTGVFDFNAYGAASSAVSTFNSFQPMRVVPTITYSGVTYNNCSGATAAPSSPSGIKTYVVVGALGGLNAIGNFTASAEL